MIEVRNLSMNYGDVQAVKDCNFTVSKGEIVGLVGPNGAGKSTIMKILATQIYPTSGTARINGFDIEKAPLCVKQNLGFLPEQAPLYDEMEVREYLDFTARARGLVGDMLSQRLKWVCENCGLVSVWCRPIAELSKGYRQRVGLAQALVHDPPVLILDEPTSGLDPLQIMEIRKLIKDLSQDKAILFSSHILQEITAVTDRAVVINGGKITADGHLEELSSKVFPEKRLRVVISPHQSLSIEEMKRVLEGLCKEIKLDGDAFVIVCEKILPVKERIAELALERSLKILEMSEEKANLEEVFSALLHTKNDHVR